MTRREPLKVKDITPGMKLSGHVHECPNCKEWFVARLDAVVCSNACRVALSRKKAREK